MYRRSWILLSFIIFLTVIITACNDQGSAGQDADYEATKKMVVDILQTEDGKKALSDILSDEKLKERLVIESDAVQNSINNVLVSEQGSEMWKNLFNDPSFVKNYATSIQEEHNKLIKGLMSDAEYQKQMIEILQNPEITEQMLTLMKSQQFREHLQEVVQQTLESPLFQEKIKETLLKAAEEQSQGQGQGQGGEESGEKEGGGEQSEGGAEGGGNGGGGN